MVWQKKPPKTTYITQLCQLILIVSQITQKIFIPKKVLKIILHVNVNELHQAKPLLREQTGQNDYQTAK